MLSMSAGRSFIWGRKRFPLRWSDKIMREKALKLPPAQPDIHWRPPPKPWSWIWKKSSIAWF